MTPLYDMRHEPELPIWAVLAVFNPLNREDPRSALGVPTWVGLDRATETAKARGWHVVGIWRQKAAEAA